jgi:hypothetical protein
MGMYTGLIFDAYLKEETRAEWWEIILYLTDCKNNKEPPTLPNHPFFKCDRWRQLSGGGSSLNDEFPPDSTFKDLGKYQEEDRYHLHMSCNLKDNGEIETFIDWIKPHIQIYVYGWTKFEEDEEKTNIKI